MPHLTTLDELKQHVTLLASVEESDAPFISCYLIDPAIECFHAA